MYNGKIIIKVDYKLKIQIWKITHLEKVRYIKVNKLKLTQVELFCFFFFTLCMLLLMHLKCFVWPILRILNDFFTILIIRFKYKILYTHKLASLSLRKSTHVRESAFTLRNE